MSTETAQHTPGPWSAHGYIVQAGEAGEYCCVAKANQLCENGQPRANARLMAAAPELLKVCKMVAYRDDILSEAEKRHIIFNDVLTMCQAAIAKAEGAADAS